MTIFAILLPSPQPALVEKIKQVYPSDYLMVTDTQWLISSSGTAAEITKKLSIYDAENSEAPSSGNAIVLTVSSYFGRAPVSVWEWMKSKLEASPNG